MRPLNLTANESNDLIAFLKTFDSEVISLYPSGSQFSCVPESKESCTISNGIGEKICNSTGTAYGSCTVKTCNTGYRLNTAKTACELIPPPPVCTANSVAACSIANGTGQKTCNSTGTAYGSCTVKTCNTGYRLNTAKTACELIPPPISVNGQCGSSVNSSFSSSPSANLCSSGTATTVVANFTWSWTCNGSTGGTSASCIATRLCPTTLSPLPVNTPWSTKVIYSYCLALKRFPDENGYNIYNSKSYLGVSELLKIFVTSTEFSNRFLNGQSIHQAPTQLYVERVYQHVLGRNADPGGLANYVHLINSETITRENLVDIFVTSSEFRSKFGSFAD